MAVGGARTPMLGVEELKCQVTGIQKHAGSIMNNGEDEGEAKSCHHVIQGSR
jgi:hypothetical protein